MIYKKSWKYILTSRDTECSYLFRLKAVRNFSDITKGSLGGYVQGYYNLSQTGNCWVYNEAVVRENAKITENARIYDKAKVCGYAQIFGNAKVSGLAYISRHVQISGYANIKKSNINQRSL